MAVIDEIIKVFKSNNNNWMSSSEVYIYINKEVFGKNKKGAQGHINMIARDITAKDRYANLFEVDSSGKPQKYRLLSNGANEELATGDIRKEKKLEDTNGQYTLDQCSVDLGIKKKVLERWIKCIKYKKQCIIYGPPGTGKTYSAKSIAKYLASNGNGKIELVQFHPGYSYEEFIQGLRPKLTIGGKLEYGLERGRLLEFCKDLDTRNGDSVLIIDEINRANLTRVFGELMYLLEYRDSEIPLAGGGVFKLPSNLFIIGTMNTADRSIALVDYALRRRFAFLELEPNYDILTSFFKDTDYNPKPIIDILIQLNKQIGDKNYMIGISYFLDKDIRENIDIIWTSEIEPYLEEYFFDQPDKVTEFKWDHIAERVTK